MSANEQSTIFNEFNASFDNGSEFPSDANKQIPSELLHCIDLGNKQFFSGFLKDFPKLYEVLVHKCSRIHLLESTSIGMSLDDLGVEYNSYWWGLKYNNKLITADIPVANSDDSVNMELNEKYLRSLPEGFDVFYKNMNGMAIAEGIGPSGYDLPSSFSDWDELKNYFEDKGLPQDLVGCMYKDLPDSDLRVFIKSTDGRLIVSNLSGSTRQLYFISNDYKSYMVIDKPIENLDLFFSKAIKEN